MRYALIIGLLALGCGEEDSDSDGGRSDYANDTGQPCSTPLDCDNGEVCVALGDRTTCHATCTGSADECGARGSCGGVASVSVDICRPAPDPEASEPAPQPRLPCQTDDDCKRYADNAVCGEWRGMRDCTIECANDDACNPPAAGGISARFAECGRDESADRPICVPRAACFERPSDCYSFPTPGGDPPAPGFDDFGGF